MADFNALQAIINAYIKRNGVQAITGQILNGVLTGMVNALGKGYTVAGAASPTTDPGTMTGPLAYIAYTAGTYTHFDNIVVEQGEVSMLIYNEAEWHKEVLFSLAAQATVDDNIGVPSVGVSFVDGILTFNFRNMKGEPGENGQDGDPAGFGTISASISGGVGTPGVSVQSSGPDTAKNIAFQFTNLKGETGVTSCVVTVDNTTGNPSCAVSLVGQELHLDFSGLKGAQGNTGSSVDYPYELVNNLTTNDATKGLSAAQGVVLDGKVSQLEAKVVEIKGGSLSKYNLVDMSKITTGYGIYQSNGNIGTNADLFITDYIPVNGSDIISNGFANSYWGGAVYDANKTKLRGFGTLQYTYQSGDAYIRISFRTNNSTPMANYGTTLSPYEPYNPIGGYLADSDRISSEQGTKITNLENTTLRKAEVVNNFVEGGVDKPFSAEKGKVMHEAITDKTFSSFSVTIADKLKYDPETGKIVTAASGHQIQYKQFSEDTIVRVKADKVSTSHISALGISASLPADGVVMNSVTTYESVGAIEKYLIIPAGSYLCMYVYYAENTDLSFETVAFSYKTDRIPAIEKQLGDTVKAVTYGARFVPSIVSNLLYNGSSFESGNANRKAAYLLCTEDETIFVTGTLSDATKVIYCGIMDNVPAIGGTMSNQIAVSSVGAFSLKIDVPAGKYFCFAFHEVYATGLAYSTQEYFDFADMQGDFKGKYDDRILDVEYSVLTEQPNSIYFFNQAVSRGFRALKADMRLTADNKIVLCHDAGFTFDSNGRITTFDVNNCTLIHDMTFAEVVDLEFSTPVEGENYVHPGTLDEFLVLCKRNAIVPYLTFRPEYVSETTESLWDSLILYGMEKQVIINLFRVHIPTIDALKTKQKDWLICDTRYTDESLTQSLIDTVSLNDCAYLCLYGGQRDSVTTQLVKYASGKNVRIWLYGTPTEQDLMLGISGFQNYTINPI